MRTLSRETGVIIFLSACSLACGGIARSKVLFWIEGRTNDCISGLLWSLIGYAAWILIATVAGVVVLVKWPRMPWSHRLLCATTLVLVLSPLIIGDRGHPEEIFEAGFQTWAASNVDCKAIREWYLNAGSLEPTDEPPAYWPGADELRVRKVHPSEQPEAISRLRPDEAWSVGNGRGAMLEWRPNSFGWVRFVFVAVGESESVPTELDAAYMDWLKIDTYAFVGIRRHN